MQFFKRLFSLFSVRHGVALGSFALLAAAVRWMGPDLALNDLRPLSSVASRATAILLLSGAALTWALRGPVGAIMLVCACVIVWHVGPLISLGSSKPLGSVGARVTAIGMMVVASLLFWAGRKWLRSGRHPLFEFLRKGREGAEGSEDSAVAVRASFRHVLSQLKRLRARQGVFQRMLAPDHYLYELPLYLVVGSPGSGKTTALQNAGFQLPVLAPPGEAEEEARPTEGAAGFEWWITDDAVLADIAAFPAPRKVETKESSADPCHTLLGLLRKHRSRAPINGLVLTLDAERVLAHTPASRSDQARSLRELLLSMRQRLGVRFPVYVMVTKMDMLSGFEPYFESEGGNLHRHAWGFSLLSSDAECDRAALARRLAGELSTLHASLAEGVCGRFERESSTQRRKSLFALPQEFANLAMPLRLLLEDIFAPSRFDGTQRQTDLRGVYFTSAAQTDAKVAAHPSTLVRRLDVEPGSVAPSAVQTEKSAESVGQALQATGKIQLHTAESQEDVVPAAPKPQQPMRHRSYFLSGLFSEVIFPEAHLVRPNLRWERRRKMLRLAGHGAALGIFLWWAGGLAVSFRGNQAYLRAVAAEAATLREAVDAARVGERPEAVPEILSGLHRLPTASGLDPAEPPTALRYGLYTPPRVVAAAEKGYATLQEKVLLPSIVARLAKVLQESISQDQPDRAYDALRAYQLLHDPSHFAAMQGAREIREWVMRDWEETDSVDVFQGRTAMIRHVESLFSGARVVNAASLRNEGLVRQAQTYLARMPAAQRIYARALAAMHGQAPPEFSIVRTLGPQAASLFTRSDGLPRTQGVPGIFTFAGYHGLFDKQVSEFVGSALRDDAWVMGRDAEAAPTDRGAPPMQDEIRRLYLTDYAAHWERFLGSIRAVSGNVEAGANLGFELSVVRQFVATDSPLNQLARAAVRETTLTRSFDPLPAAAAGLAEKTVPGLGKPGDAVEEGGGSRPHLHLERRLVDDRFAALREVVTGHADGRAQEPGDAEGSPTAAISSLLNEFYASLAVADAALAAGAPPPVGTDVGARLRLEASKMPAPFRDVLTGLASSGSDKVQQNATDILRKEARFQLDRINGVLKFQVDEPCMRGIDGRFPVAASTREATMEDFSAFFAAGGAVDEFFSKNLAPYVDTSVRPWRYRVPGRPAAAGAPADAAGVGELLRLLATSGPRLEPFYRAQQIREVFFREGGGKRFSWRAELRVGDLDPEITDLIIDIDGRSERYVHGPVQPFSISWPGPRGGAMAELTANPRVSTATSSALASGPWAVFQLFDKGRALGTTTPGLMRVEYDFDGRKAVLDVSASSQANPLDPQLLRGFQCPSRSN